MTLFLPARELLGVIGAAAAAAVPTEYGRTVPCPVRGGDAALLRTVFFLVSGTPDACITQPPAFVLDINGSTAVVQRLARCTPEEVACVPPFGPVPGAGVDASRPAEDYVRRRNRLRDLCPAVWEAFVTGPGALDVASDTDVREFFELLLSTTPASAAPYYAAVAPEFFGWLRATAGAP